MLDLLTSAILLSSIAFVAIFAITGLIIYGIKLLVRLAPCDPPRTAPRAFGTPAILPEHLDAIRSALALHLGKRPDEIILTRVSPA